MDKALDRNRVIRLITEVGDMAQWSKNNRNEWYKDWKVESVRVTGVLEDLWKSWKSNKHGVLKAKNA